jgi:UDP-4-amino-4,6-dideoxy-N-acetyl-beta-L-altrosamine transaminase/dTDP-4-dehydrorhamnose reductase
MDPGQPKQDLGGVKQRTLITGGSGLLALNWALAIRADQSVTLGSRGAAPTLTGVGAQTLALDSVDAIARVLDAERPHLVVHTAGLANVDRCEREPELAHHANVELAANVAAACARTGVAMVHISTDHLFDGTQSMVDESQRVCPLNVYGRTKAEAEVRVLQALPTALVVRTNFYGWGPSYRRSFVDFVVDSLRSATPIWLYTDILYTPILIQRLALDVHQLMETGVQGVINVVGDERLSKHEFGLRTAAHFGLDVGLIRACTTADRPLTVPRPLDMSLSNARARARLGRGLGGVKEQLTMLSLQPSQLPLETAGTMIPYGKHHIDESDIQAVTAVLRSGALTQGPAVERFESAIAGYVGAKYAVAVASGTAGLHLAAVAAGAGPGAALVTSPITFVASSNASLYAGGTVAFCDVDPATINMSAASLRATLARTPDAKVVMPVHFAGLPCDIESISAIARDAGAAVVEDAAHALGATYPDGRRVGCCAHSVCTVLSFHPVKAIAAGEGGMITTNDPAIYRRLLRLRSHGINKLDDAWQCPDQAFTNGVRNPWYYEMQELGYHFRITDIQCELALSQFKKLDQFISRRRQLVLAYDRAFAGHARCKSAQSTGRDRSGHHLYVLRVDFAGAGTTRAAFMNALRERGVGTQVHYIPVPAQPYYRALGFDPQNYPMAWEYYQSALTIPLYYDLTDEQQHHVVTSIKELLR